MIDFLVEKRMSKGEIRQFLSSVFQTDYTKIIVVTLEEFNEIGEIYSSNIDCLCVFSNVHGNASLLLQLYRYTINIELAMKQIINVCVKEGITCYLPKNSLNEWICVDKGGHITNVKQIDEERDDVYLFVITAPH